MEAIRISLIFLGKVSLFFSALVMALSAQAATPKPTVSVSFSPSAVTTGQNSTLNWSSTNATSCSGSPTTATSGSKVYPITTTSNWSYTITCTGPGGTTSTTAVLSVTVPPKPTVTASFTPSTVKTGDQTTLNWSATNATSCDDLPATSGSKNYPVLTTSDWTVTVTCTGYGGKSSATTTLKVTPPPKPTVRVSFSPSAVMTGQDSTLSWSSTDATSCSGSPTTATSGSKVYPITTTSDWSYTVTCTGPGGTTSSTAVLKVTVPPKPVVTAYFSPSNVKTGDQTILNWSATNATSCDDLPGTSGSKNYPVLTTSDWTVTVTCTGYGGKGSATTILKVTPPPKPTVNVSFNPAAVMTGQDSTLSWSSTDATSCSGSPTTATSGSKVYPITTTSDWSYTVTCTGPGGTTSSTAVLKVTVPPKPVVTAYFSPSNVKTGDQTTLNWSATNATSCDDLPGISGSKNYPVLTTSDWTVTVTCTGPGGTGTATTTLYVSSPAVPKVTNAGLNSTMSPWAIWVVGEKFTPAMRVQYGIDPAKKIDAQITYVSAGEVTFYIDESIIPADKCVTNACKFNIYLPDTYGATAQYSFEFKNKNPVGKLSRSGEQCLLPAGGTHCSTFMKVEQSANAKKISCIWVLNPTNLAACHEVKEWYFTWQYTTLAAQQFELRGYDNYPPNTEASRLAGLLIDTETLSALPTYPLGTLGSNICYIYENQETCTTKLIASSSHTPFSCLWFTSPVKLIECSSSSQWETNVLATKTYQRVELRAHNSIPENSEQGRLSARTQLTYLDVYARSTLAAAGSIEGDQSCELSDTKNSCSINFTVKHSGAPVACLWELNPAKLIKCDSSIQTISQNITTQKAEWSATLNDVTAIEKSVELRSHLSLPIDTDAARLSGKLLDTEKVVAVNGAIQVWREFADALKNNNRTKLNQLLDPGIAADYEAIFDILGPEVADVGKQIEDTLEPLHVSERVAEYLIIKKSDDNQSSYAHVIRLVKDKNNKWKINSL